MNEELTPSVKQNHHGVVVRYFLIFISFINSLIFVNSLAFGALFYHLYDKITGKEKFYLPDDEKDVSSYKARDAYPDIEKMKPSRDLRYYALNLGLELEEHKITTEDGYILVLHHLYDPKATKEEMDAKKPVLMQHGLLSCSGAYLTAGQNSLAYYMVEMGYDVWLGNNRSGFNPEHESFEGNLMHNEAYWDWDIRDMAYYDLPCIIKNVLSNKPNHSKLVLFGHSQGCTQSFLMLKNENLRHIQEKVEHFFALAPAIFPGSLFHNKMFIKFMHHRGPLGFKLIFGTCSFLRNLGQARHLLASTGFFGFLSYIMFKFLFGWTSKKWGRDKKVWHFHFIFNVSYVSTKLMSWWLSEWVQEGFSNQLQPKKAYEIGLNHKIELQDSEEARKAEKDDSKTFFPFKKAWFSPEDPVVPIFIFSGDLDFLVDGKRLITHMRNYEQETYKEDVNLRVVELDDYSHLDVVWADDLIGRIGHVIHKTLENTNKGETQEVVTEKDV